MSFRLFLTITITSLLMASCQSKDASSLQEKMRTEYAQPEKLTSLSSGSKAQYIQMEKSINKKYVKNLDSLANTAFDRQLERFEDEELGVWSGYLNMFSWLFQSKQSWDDEMQVMSNKYFNTLDVNQEQHVLYIQYSKRISELRRQFLSSQNLPSYTQIDIPSESIALTALSDHSRSSIAIEFGTELFSWFLGFVILQIALKIVDALTKGKGCLIDIVVFIITIIVSILLANHNDSKLIDNLREQHQQNITIDNRSLIQSLDDNTIKFYETL